MARPNFWDESQAREIRAYSLKQLKARDWGWFVDAYVEAMGLPKDAQLDPIPSDDEMIKAILDKEFPPPSESTRVMNSNEYATRSNCD